MAIYIINKKRFNTDTSTLADSRGRGYVTDFGYWHESLYLSPNGQWWIHGQGGALSHYSVRLPGGGWGGSERAWTISADEALQFLEGENSIAAIEQFFGEEISNG